MKKNSNFMSKILESSTDQASSSSLEKDNQEKAHYANMTGLITSLIKSISYASSREELAYIVRITRDFIHDYAPNNKQLISSLNDKSDREEMKLSEEDHVPFDKKHAISTKSDHDLYTCLLGAKEINLSSLSLKEAIEAEQKKEKSIDEEKSKFKPESILSLGRLLHKSRVLQGTEQDRAMKKVSQFKVKLILDKSGKLVPEDKTLRMADDLSRHQLEELEIHKLLLEQSILLDAQAVTSDKEEIAKDIKSIAEKNAA